jgi:hypothetical protein
MHNARQVSQGMTHSTLHAKIDLYKRISSSELASIMTTANIRHNQSNSLLPVPHPGNLGVPHLLLQLEDTVHQRLGCGWASRNVNVDRYDPVASSGDRVAVVVVTTSVGAATHGDDPSWIGHLIVNLS